MISNRHNSISPGSAGAIGARTVPVRSSRIGDAHSMNRRGGARRSACAAEFFSGLTQALLPRPTTKERGEGRGEGNICGLNPLSSVSLGSAGAPPAPFSAPPNSTGVRASERAAGFFSGLTQSLLPRPVTKERGEGRGEGNICGLNPFSSISFESAGAPPNKTGARASERAAGASGIRPKHLPRENARHTKKNDPHYVVFVFSRGQHFGVWRRLPQVVPELGAATVLGARASERAAATSGAHPASSAAQLLLPR